MMMETPTVRADVTLARTARALAVVLLGTAVVSGALAGIGQLPRSGMQAALAVVVLLAAPAGALAAFGVMLSRSESQERTFWMAGTHGAGALLLGEVCEVLLRLDVVPGNALLPVVQIIAFVAAAVFGGVAARRLVGSTDALGDNAVGHWLDILVIFFAVFIVMLTLILPTLRSAPLSYVRGLVLALIPSLAVALVVYTTVFKRSPWNSWQVLAAAWIGFLGLKDTAAAVIAPVAARAHPPGSPEVLPIDAMLVFGYLLAVAAVVERLRTRAALGPQAMISSSRIWPALAAPAVLILLAPLVYLTLEAKEWRQEDIWIVVTVGIGVGLATTARSYLIATENSSLRRHSTTDPLTGLANHRHFHERLGTEVDRAHRAECALSIVAIDVDDFDRVNNVYGHATGDKRLRSIANGLTAAARKSDLVCRVGGDEFTIIMPETDAVEAYKVCLRLQDYLHEPDETCPLPVSLSMGIASLPEHADSCEDLVQRADGALYWAKFHGREQIVIYDAELVRSLGPEERIVRLEEESYLKMVQLLSSAVDARDPYTHHHSRRVAELAVALARRLGSDPSHVALLETAALLHDVGKIGVPDVLLRKQDRLDEHERALVQEHPLLAARILGAIPRQEVLPWIASHHERWDGTGYPAGLAGEQIPVPSRIIALCDAFDAMTSDRPYRARLPIAVACDEIRANAGSQFDPLLAEQFVAMVREEQARVDADEQAEDVAV